MNSEITFISKNVKVIQNSVKRIKLWLFEKLPNWKWIYFSTRNALLYE